MFLVETKPAETIDKLHGIKCVPCRVIATDTHYYEFIKIIDYLGLNSLKRDIGLWENEEAIQIIPAILMYNY